MASTSSSPAPPLDRGVLLVAGVVILGAFMSILDITVVNVALNTLAARVRHDADDGPVGRDRLHARARHRHPAHGLGGRPLRHQAPLHDLDRPVRRRFRAVGGRLERRVADLLPRHPGPRRRHADARRHDDPHPRRRSAARRPRHGRSSASRCCWARSSARSSAASWSTTSPGAGSSSSTCRSAPPPWSWRSGSCRVTSRSRPTASTGLGLALLSPGLAAVIYGLAESSSAGGFGHPEVYVPAIGRRAGDHRVRRSTPSALRKRR